ncbi:c-type cytochrome [Rheinheimera sp. MM224]|uniref:c-type cytochrome n=1 Tax=Rheinheimera sp. MM224 TaxID=3019969 RepID=UPI0021F91B9B|nr:cytochrome c [Rheinheimera sp. MM224]CAI3798333.1 Cytochrome c6 [Rheinheimera sp. MM224]
MIIKPTFVGLIVLAVMGANAFAAGDAEAGKVKSAVCSACHGADGNSLMAMYPHLAGQQAQYLESAMKAYRDGQRTGGTAAMMAPMAASLSDQDIADLSAYFSQQKLKQN